MVPALFDAHFHIVDPRHPLIPNNGYVPPNFSTADYKKRTKDLNVVGGAIVSGSFQAFDTGYLVAALRSLGPSFVGVAQVPGDISDSEVLRLDASGVRGVRFNLARGGSAGLEELDSLARHCYDIAGWHTEVYVDSRHLPALHDVLANLPAVSIDHLGLSQEGLPHLLRLVEQGVKVKATGFGRVDLNTVEAMHAIMEVDPSALMAGTDLPSTRATRPFSDEDLQLIQDSIAPEQVEAVFHKNAEDLYLDPIRL
ncbi:4-sulfomuconolactone hydrolase [Corynebacterium atrinae]|uniref:amidohydrolase family protein n=1 Tax=Corynebacterium atrinae TaxID=1336740 RepID=UPI0025B55AE4|nr:amidohydrolase family protein [Corynebacterium atrinae]WJY63353.1 4-sulfomuconolactone hydrolase [Corynebacterium atrinae]